MNRRTRVYVAGPYTKPDPCVNTHEAVKTATVLLKLGYAPFVPHLSHFWHTMTPMPYEAWLDYDNQFLPCCDCVLRLPGESSGADKEVELAKSLGIRVLYGTSDLLTHIAPVIEAA